MRQSLRRDLWLISRSCRLLLLQRNKIGHNGHTRRRRDSAFNTTINISAFHPAQYREKMLLPYISTFRSSIANSKWYKCRISMTFFILWLPTMAHFALCHDLLALLSHLFFPSEFAFCNSASIAATSLAQICNCITQLRSLCWKCDEN